MPELCLFIFEKNIMKKNKNFKEIFKIYNIIFYLFFIFISIKKTDKTLSKIKEYKKKKFAIIIRKCPSCGLFSVYMASLGCIHKYLIQGYIPIIDIKSFPNIINGFNISKGNYWEIFFEQPFGYTLDEVMENALKIKRIICSDCEPRLYHRSLPFSSSQQNFWHNFANKYMPIKKETINLSNKMMNNLFNHSRNILGVLTRGTDYIYMKPKFHPIPPNLSVLIHDVTEMDKIYNYDYIFFSTEDEIIRDKFSKCFPNKIKQLKPKTKLNYNKLEKNFLGFNDNIKGNVEYFKIQ